MIKTTIKIDGMMNVREPYKRLCMLVYFSRFFTDAKERKMCSPDGI